MEISSLQYNDIIEELADRAVDAQVKLNDDVFRGSSWRNGKYERNAEVIYYDEFLKELKKRYPLDKVTQEDLFNLENFKGEEARNWLKNAPGSYSPGDKAKSVEAAKFLPLLQGVAKDGESWYDIDAENLRKLGFDAGYKTGSKEGFKEYLDKIGEYQKEFDRYRNLKEWRDDMGAVPYWISRLAFPMATREAENAILTGEGDEDTVKKLAALDAVANIGTMLAPGTFGTATRTLPLKQGLFQVGVLPKMASRPLVAGTTDAFLQAAIEGGRQGAGSAFSDTGIEFDPAMMLAAGAAGATRPGIINVAQGLSTRLPGPEAQQFARGVARATRKGDPSAMERQALERAARGYNDNLAGRWNKNLKVPTFNMEGKETGQMVEFRPTFFSDATRAAELRSQSQGLQKAKVLDAVRDDGKGHLYIDIAKMLNNYDRPVKELQTINGDGVMQYFGGAPSWQARFPKVTVLGSENADKFKSAFPARYEDATSMTPYNAAGIWTGKALGDVGSRLEPTFKLNPMNLSQYTKEPDYKREEWYSNLSDEQKKVVDEAYKRKLEELSK